MNKNLVRTLGVGGAVTAAVAASLIGAAPAQAAPALTVVYDAQGTTFLAKAKANVALPKTTLTTALNADGTFTGSLALKPTTAEFKVLGFVPTKATVSFIEAAPLTGKLTTKGRVQSVTSTATYYVKLSNVTLAGIPTGVGDKCQTKVPISIPVSTPAGGSFNIEKGGTVTGTYTLGEFANCGLTTGIINLLVPGPGNTVSIDLSNGRISS